jgi:titin
LDVAVSAGEVTRDGYDGPGAIVTWAPPASDGGLPLTYYRVSWTGGQFDQPASEGTSTFVQLPAYGVSYSFLVIAFNSLGNGPASPAVAAVALTVPGAPGNFSARAVTGTTLDLTWSPPSSDGGSTLTGYKVDWGGQGAWGEAVEPASATTASVQLPAQGVYEVSVLATNSAGDGPPSAPACVTVGTSAPCAPTITGEQAAPGQAKVTWSPSADSGSSPVTSYTVNWTGPNAASSGRLVQPASAGTTATLTLGAVGQYSVTVSATSSAGAGPASAPATFTYQLPSPKPCSGRGGNCPRPRTSV